MVITCPACRKEHILGDKTIPKGFTKVRCGFCHRSFELRQKNPTFSHSTSDKTTPHKIGVSISKGGVGKTTTSVNLAAGLACRGKKVLLIDTDTQGQDAYHLGVHPKFGLADFITGKKKWLECLFKARKNLWLLNGGRNLASMKQFIDRRDFGGEKTLAEKLQQIEKAFDYVIVDTAPGWDSLTINVLFYVREILIPVSLEAMTLQGLSQFAKSLKKIQTYNNSIALRYIVPTFYDLRIQKAPEILDKLAEMHGDKLCTPIRCNVSLSEAPAFGKTIYEYAPGSNGAKDYRQLSERILQDHEEQESAYADGTNKSDNAMRLKPAMSSL